MGKIMAKKLIPGVNDLATLRPEIAAAITESSPSHSWEILPYSRSIIEVRCPGCGEERATKACTITSAFCRRCAMGVAQQRRVVKLEDSLSHRFPEIASQVSPESSLQPSEVSAYSTKELLWICDNGEEHCYSMRVHNKTYGKQSCPYCRGTQVLQGFNDVSTLDPEVASLFSPDSPVHPWEVTIRSGKKALFACGKGHEWESIIFNVTRGSRCPSCSYEDGGSLGERELYEYVLSLGVSAERSNRSLLGRREVDIYVASHRVALEYNGEYWHREGVMKEVGYHEQKTHDLAAQGITLLHVWENEWRSSRSQVEARVKDLLRMQH